jgi:hypothetical protein
MGPPHYLVEEEAQFQNTKMPWKEQNYGHWSQRSRKNKERLCWRGPAVNHYYALTL